MLGDNLAADGGEKRFEPVWWVHGVVRDTEAIGQLALGVQGAGHLPAQDRQARSEGLSATCRCCSWAAWPSAPGEWLYADEDGVVVADTDLRPMP